MVLAQTRPLDIDYVASSPDSHALIARREWSSSWEGGGGRGLGTITVQGRRPYAGGSYVVLWQWMGVEFQVRPAI